MPCSRGKQKTQKKKTLKLRKFLLVCFVSFMFRTQSCVYFFSTFSLFTACPQGTFKSSQGAGLCQQCPLNSRSTIEAATLCGCRNGYYRGDMDKPEDVCTSESVKQTHAQENYQSTRSEIIPLSDQFTFVIQTEVSDDWHITAICL